jgi:hypothetical protein
MNHNAWHIAIAVPSKAVTPLMTGSCMVMLTAPQVVVIHRMRVSCTFRRKEHLNAHDYKDSCHGYETRHGRIALVPKVWETWVSERLERGREEVNEGRGYEDAGSEVSREE